MLLRVLISTCICSLLLCKFVFAGEDTVLAKVGDYVFRKSDFERVMSYYPADKQKFLQDNPKQKIILIKQLLEAKIVSDIARKEGFDKITEVNEKLQYLINNYLYKEYLAHVAIQGVIVTEDDQKQYYSLYKNKFFSPEQVRVRHILFKISTDMSEETKKKKRENAELVLEKLKKGEDFAELAKEYSEEPRSAKKGGDLGYRQKDKMYKPFAEAAFSLKPVGLSGIVETDAGYHIIKVEDYKEAGTKPFEEVKDSIRQQLQNEFAQAKAKEFLEKTLKDAGLEVYSDKITGEPAKAE